MAALEQIYEAAAEAAKESLEGIKEDEKLYNYELECVKLDALKQTLCSEDYAEDAFDPIKKFRILKFPIILQNVLYLLGYKREDINLPGTHILNWKKV